DGYHRHCAEMLRRYGQTTRPEIAERTAKVCLLHPRAGDDLKQPAELADRALTLDRAHWVIPWAQLVKGLADYRTGRFDDAAVTLRKSLAEKPTHWAREVPATVILAMAEARRGRGEEARRTLARADELFEATPAPERGLPPGWLHDWLFCRILRREAH